METGSTEHSDSQFAESKGVRLIPIKEDTKQYFT
jgi:hypothetical protein